MLNLNYYLFTFLLLSCLYIIYKTYVDTDKFYQYPALSSLATMIFILPSLFFTLNQPSILSIYSYNLYVFNAILCFWAGIFGNYVGSKHQVKKTDVNVGYSYDKLIRILTIYVIIGGAASAFVPAESFGNETTGGMVAILIYFARLLRPAAIILFCLYLIRKRVDTLLLFGVWFVFAMQFLIISGRRSEFFTILTVFGFPLFFIKNFKIKKQLIFPALFVAFFVIILFPIIRPYTKAGEFDKIADISLKPVIDDFTSGERPNEIVDAAFNVTAVNLSGEYNYGYKTIYNAFVNQYASKTLFGEGLKERLSLSVTDMDQLRTVYRMSSDKNGFLYYLTPTGYGSAFTEFSYFGCIMYFIYAYVSARIYKRAKATKRLDHVVLAIFIGLMTLFAVYDSITAVIATYLPPYLLVYFHSFSSSKVKQIKLPANG